MTKLLISVKNVEESRLALYAGVDVIDLKDPSVGALGALAPEVVRQIVHEINGRVLISATVGEGHETIAALKADIALYAGLGVDVVKVAVSPLFLQPALFEAFASLTAQGLKLVAVFFADQALDFSLIKQLQKSGCYGVMLDTKSKQQPLLAVQAIEVLQMFVERCEQCQLVSGLAGSVNVSHLAALLSVSPAFIGMRGGVCQQSDRTSSIDEVKIVEAKAVLLNCNTALP